MAHKLNIYYFPPKGAKGGYSNPYSQNFRDSLSKCATILNREGRNPYLKTLPLLWHSFRADIIIYNWIESVGFYRFGWLQMMIALISIRVMKLRGKKVVWMFHNLTPHQGEDRHTEKIQRLLFNSADLIISHSRVAESYARQHAKVARVEYICHPVMPRSVSMASEKRYDALIWGSILPYKGIYECISSPQIRESNLRIHIAGRCKDSKLASKITACCNKNITFENRFLSDHELSNAIAESRYVLFPYLKGSVSSSGALIDSIAMGATVVGPDTGAFNDLHSEGMCLVYNTYDELVEILSGQNSIPTHTLQEFIDNNSWENFGKRFFEFVNALSR